MTIHKYKSEYTMRLFKTLVVTGLTALVSSAFAQQTFTGSEAVKLCPGSSKVVINKQSNVPSFVHFGKNSTVHTGNVFDVMRNALKMRPEDTWQQTTKLTDKVDMLHTRYQQYYNGVKVSGGEYIVHERNGRVESINGMFFDGINLSATPALAQNTALEKALAHIGARSYKWDSEAEEHHLQEISRNPSSTYRPKGELMIVAANGDILKKEMHLVWRFDVYATEPMSRNYVYVDAQTGAIVDVRNRIHEIDVNGTANTMYSGTQNIVCDNFNAGQYRLREAGRGQGIQTYNLANSTNQGNAVDFVNNSSNWTSTTNDDHAAYDAHWGAEKTYDYYWTEHNRDGIDGSGMLMVSYVHYGSNYNNAFWDGTAMSYGDGSGTSGGFNPLTAIDVCGHEFTHGVTENTANLDYQDESGALNESFSDVFGTSIEFYAKPQSANFQIGEQITVNVGSALRSMSNPNQFGDPDCYNGTNWYTGTADNGGVHTNSGVQNYWFYLLCQGASGTNDLGNTFNVTSIGMTDAARIAFRNLTVYLVSTSQYMDARTYAIQSAEDLFGACTPQVEATTNAWYACGVGGPYSPVVQAAFTPDITSSCSLPANVSFTNTSTNSTNAVWNFGDNTTSTQYNATHTYTTAGTFNVQLVVSSACGTDSVLQSSLITINPPASPATTGASSCTPAALNLGATGSGTLQWFSQPTGGTSINTGTSYTTPLLNNTTTYYVENQVAQTPGNVGPASFNFGGGGQHNNTSTQYLEFTVYQNCTLVTADVNAGASGTRTFTLWDSQGNQLNQYTPSIPNGQSTVTLNIPLTPGSYRIGGTQMNLYRNNSGANYPYTFNGVLDITGSSAGSGFYYYLYNWSVAPAPCTSARIPVVATIGLSNVTYNASAYDTTCQNSTAPFALSGGSPAGGTYSGPGVSGGMFNPGVAGPGTHTITYTYTDSSNCSGTATQTVFVDVCTGVSNSDATTSVSVYPNPAHGNFNLNVTLAQAQPISISVVDLLGQVMISETKAGTTGTQQLPVNTAGWSEGIYMVQVKTATGVFVQRVVIR